MVEQCYYQNLLYAAKKKKSRFMKKQERKRLWSSLDFKASLNKIPLLGKILF